MFNLDTIRELLLLVAVGTIMFLLGSLRSYAAKKGENLATLRETGCPGFGIGPAGGTPIQTPAAPAHVLLGGPRLV